MCILCKLGVLNVYTKLGKKVYIFTIAHNMAAVWGKIVSCFFCGGGFPPKCLLE